MYNSEITSSLLKMGVSLHKSEEIFEGWLVFHKESLKGSFCCWVCCFLIGKWRNLIIGGKHFMRESMLNAKMQTGAGTTQN